MKQEKLEDRLQMRRLTVDDTAQYNALLRYAFQVTDSELASLGWNQKEMERSKKPVLKKTESFGWFDGEKLASQISVYPMQVNLFGTMYNMGGVTGVATYPEYMGHGLMAHLMKKALDNMRENHQCVSMLFPYLIPYYRKKGWEIVSDKMTYTIKDTQLPKHRTSTARMCTGCTTHSPRCATARSSVTSWSGRNTGGGRPTTCSSPCITTRTRSRPATSSTTSPTTCSASRSWCTSIRRRATACGTISPRTFR